jgi:hypothetical protein
MKVEPKRFCVYCGDFYECRDHVVPVSWLRVFRDYREYETVACCFMCNRLAGDYPATSLCDKAFYLLRRYEFKYQKILALPHWDQSEINELKGSLKERVKRNQFLKELLKRKIDNLELVMNGFQAIEIDRY